MSDVSGFSALAGFPLQQPPSGVVSNFVNPPSTGFEFVVAGSVFMFLMIVFFALRMYGKLTVARKLKWDDCTCTIGFMLTCAQYVISTISTTRSFNGRHSWDISVSEIMNSDYFLLSLLLSTIPPVALGFIKLTFFIFYWQMFSPLRWARIAIIIGVALSSIFYTIVAVLAIYFGAPRPGETWIAHDIGKLGLQAIDLGVPQAAISVVFDFYILLVPLVGISSLQLTFKRKIGVSLVFLTGIMACICSMLTLHYRIQLRTTQDLFTILVPILITSVVEMQIGIICCCMPALASLVRKAQSDGSESPSRSGYRWLFASFKTRSRSRRDRYVTVDKNKNPNAYSMENINLNTETETPAMPSLPSNVHTFIGNGRNTGGEEV